MLWIEKWLTPFRIVRTFSVNMQSLGRSNYATVGAKIGVFLYVTSRISQKRCILGTKLLKNTNKETTHDLLNGATFSDHE